MVKKIVRNGDGERRSNFGLKLNVHVQYNMFEANLMTFQGSMSHIKSFTLRTLFRGLII